MGDKKYYTEAYNKAINEYNIAVLALKQAVTQGDDNLVRITAYKLVEEDTNIKYYADKVNEIVEQEAEAQQNGKTKNTLPNN